MNRIFCSCYPSAQIQPKQPHSKKDDVDVTTPLKEATIEYNESTPQTPQRSTRMSTAHPTPSNRQLKTPPTRQPETPPTPPTTPRSTTFVDALSAENVVVRGLRTAHTPHEATPNSTSSYLRKDVETQTTPNRGGCAPTRPAPVLPKGEESRV